MRPVRVCLSPIGRGAAFPAVNAGEVSGPIPLISTRHMMKGLISSEIEPFCISKWISG